YGFSFRVGSMVTMNITIPLFPIGPALRLGLLWFTLTGSHVRGAQDPFTRITSGPAVSGINSSVLAWGDFNNDGRPDLFVSTRTGGSLLYSNNGNGSFSQVYTAPIAIDSGNC